MSAFQVIITDHGFANLDQETAILRAAGAELSVAQCKQPADVIAAAAQADALLVQWAPINAAVLRALTRCRVIVRYGIGVDNIDLPAAKQCGIPVCNVPDYCIDEVADHTISLAVALARQLPQVHQRVLRGVWKITPDRPLPAFRDLVFATAGLGRIARAVLERARGLRFQLAAYDPLVDASQFAAAGVRQLSLPELFTQADILSLHAPLTPATRHIVNAQRLAQMKPTAIVVNTARGGLIDTVALADALQSGRLAGAGLDVFETEPLPADHPLRNAPNALLSSHLAWFSEASVPQLQRLAAETVARGLRGEPLNNQVT